MYLYLFLLPFLSINDVVQQPPAAAHEFHLSRTIVNYDTDQQSIQITMNMFIDDLELALKGYGADSLRLCTGGEKSTADGYIYNYILDKLIISNDDKIFQPTFIGKEPSDDLAAVWCYLEIVNVSKMDGINIANTIMTDLFDDQKNMTTIQIDKERLKDILFTKDKTESTVK